MRRQNHAAARASGARGGRPRRSSAVASPAASLPLAALALLLALAMAAVACGRVETIAQDAGHDAVAPTADRASTDLPPSDMPHLDQAPGDSPLARDATPPDAALLNCWAVVQCALACGTNVMCQAECYTKGSESAKTKARALLDCVDEKCKTECFGAPGDGGVGTQTCMNCVQGACPLQGLDCLSDK